MYPGTRSRQRENASNHAVELRLLAERKAGEALKGLERGRNQYDSGSAADTLSGASEYQKTLEESGVSERQAQRWQEIKLRIERRAGELLLAKQRGQGQRNDLLSEVASESSEYRDALDRLAEQGTSERTARDWQKIARSERRAGARMGSDTMATETRNRTRAMRVRNCLTWASTIASLAVGKCWQGFPMEDNMKTYVSILAKFTEKFYNVPDVSYSTRLFAPPAPGGASSIRYSAKTTVSRKRRWWGKRNLSRSLSVLRMHSHLLGF